MVKDIPKVFGLIALFAYVAMSATKSILLETVSFAAKLLHHEERAKYHPDNIPNFANPLAYSIEAVNDTFAFKEATSQPDRLDLVEAIIKEIGAREIDKHCILIIII